MYGGTEYIAASDHILFGPQDFLNQHKIYSVLHTVTRHFAGDRDLSAIREPFSPIETRFQGCDAEEILWLFVPYRMEQVSVYFRMETRGQTSNHKGAHCQG